MKRKTHYLIATVVSVAAYGVLTVLSRGQPWLVWPAFGALVAILVFACLWMAALDEAAQQAHYIAWYWGGSAGIGVSMLALITVVLRPDALAPLLSPFSAPETFAAGIMCGLMPPAVGYAIWWGALWLRRR
jgi:hypothetical protein